VLRGQPGGGRRPGDVFLKKRAEVASLVDVYKRYVPHAHILQVETPPRGVGPMPTSFTCRRLQVKRAGARFLESRRRAVRAARARRSAPARCGCACRRREANPPLEASRESASERSRAVSVGVPAGDAVPCPRPGCVEDAPARVCCSHVARHVAAALSALEGGNPARAGRTGGVPAKAAGGDGAIRGGEGQPGHAAGGGQRGGARPAPVRGAGRAPGTWSAACWR
jgi:hypothetical protein